ncbi:POU domain, class 6, transcription factor 2 isoform X2 [Periplaneta americana]|uniref:POU domain, class 6, transcription factor 2 isoform X2 n=1 Tax=Periplaneta americana TaxID=6978 RepID=UPI0037E7473B
MAEGGQEEDSGDVMLAAATSPATASAGACMKRDPDAPLNLKSEIPSAETNDGGQYGIRSNEESCDSNPPSPEPAAMGVDSTPMALDQHHPPPQQQQQQQSVYSMNGHNSNQSLPGTPTHNRSAPNSPDPIAAIDSAKAAAAASAAHINGTMAGMVTLQNLQNLATLQSLPQVASLAAGLQGMAGLGTQLINTPLNLSASATGSLPTSCASASPAHSVGNLLTSAAAAAAAAAQPTSALPQLLAAPQPAAMPQFILASGQLVQGIQGAQLLIPTSQGIATQTILTIPVNHVTSGQMVNLALSNGQVVTTTLANLQTLAQPHHLLAPASAAAASTVPSPSPTLGPGINLNPAAAASLPHLLTNGSTAAVQQHQQLLSAMQQPQLLPQQPSLLPATAQQNSVSNHQAPQRSSHHQQHNHHYSVPDKHHQNGLLNGTESSLNVINRLAASNSDITITSTHASPQQQQQQHAKSSSSSSSTSLQHSSSNGSGGGGGGGTQHSRGSPTSDFLADSPNQPTINQTNSNVVDGINLDEIKEFAKAFKLRRLSLGLTQTQVGQALSITEGPAYSQSAICSALATQMYCAAQLASQHQAMFEKLDITPKSAQKIKPVLEMWMKEAEERYKSGQNHLTEFIGVEPSKKRKRRTSFTPQALELLNAHFERNTHPSGTEITALAHQLGYEREVIRIWFCNKRQALKNTVRMMSKGVA